MVTFARVSVTSRGPGGPAGSIVSLTVVPAAPRMLAATSPTVSVTIVTPSTAVISSPTPRPALSAGLSGNTPSMRRPLSLSSTMVPMPTYSPDRLASASLTASGVRNVVCPSSPTASVIPLMAACARDWSSRSDAPTYSLWRRSHDSRMSANASSPVGFCDGIRAAGGHRRRGARRDPAQVERANGGEPTVDEDPDGEGEQRHHHEHRRAEPATLAPRFGRRDRRERRDGHGDAGHVDRGGERHRPPCRASWAA